ncbi:MAG: DUF2024 family protein [Cyclobacteriaceae bacterium]
MKVAVWDTYVTKPNGTVMNFDIIVPQSETNPEVIYGYGKAYLQSKAISDYPLTANQCAFCHFERATPAMEESIRQKGYFILELKNCR